MSLRLALYEPDIAANCGAMMRLCACLGVGMDVIEPCGFVWDDKKLARVAMDYVNQVDVQRHTSWQSFLDGVGAGRRIILLTTKSAQVYTDFVFRPDDILLVGRESAGVPDTVHNRADARVIIPMQAHARSLNVALASAMVLGEAIRQG